VNTSRLNGIRAHHAATTTIGGDDIETDERSGGTERPLERITVNLTGPASRALEIATQLTGDSKTDTINRALQIYAYMEQITARGGSIYVREVADSELERLKVF
jgi:hypothetical protein